MTGTSLDGLDVAVVAIRGRGLCLRANVVGGLHLPLGRVAGELRRLAGQEPMRAGEIARLARDLSLLHAKAVRRAAARRRLDLVAVHGQTVYHAPPVSWQLFSPSIVARAVGAPVVCDLRAADLAAGGQGAPITPLADFILFRSSRTPRAIVNLGGFCNVTLLPRSRARAQAGLRRETGWVRGFDVCACNQLLDAVARKALRRPFDPGGSEALRGRVLPGPFDELRRLLEGQSRGERSLGTGDEAAAWVLRHRGSGRGEDLARTACAAVAGTIARRVEDAGEILAAGGGLKNRALAGEIAARLGREALSTQAAGVPPDLREAAAMAVLGALCEDGVPITLRQATACRRPPPIAGVWARP